MRCWLLAAALLGCGARPAPREAGRRPLYVPGLSMLHQVALDMPGRSDVMIGQMRFPAPGAYHLQAQTPFGMDLFTLGFDGEGYRAEVAEPLRGRFPAESLAREIARIYVLDCAAECVETLDPATGAVTRRVFTVGGRRVDILYAEYGWRGRLWLAGRIVLSSGDYRVEVRLTDVSH